MPVGHGLSRAIRHLARVCAILTTRDRAPRFNSLYTLHRSLFVMAAVALIVLIASVFWGAADKWSSLRNGILAAMLLELLIMEWYRTKQRAYDYALEVHHRRACPRPTNCES